jgi:hypothetical protein
VLRSKAAENGEEPVKAPVGQLGDLVRLGAAAGNLGGGFDARVEQG